jgi:hypothetical protein
VQNVLSLQKLKDWDVQKYNCACLVLVWLGRSHWGRNLGWECLRIER